MILGIDFGGSLTKFIGYEDSKFILKGKINSTELKQDYDEILSQHANYNISKIVLTGGKSNLFKIDDDRIVKVNELEGLGNYLLNEKLSYKIIICVGTGTPFVVVENGKSQHVGGTGVGGGTLLGLGKLIVNEDNFERLEQLALKGNISNVNITVKDIVGSSIGMIPENATASNFAKKKGNREDNALGIYSLVGEVLGVMTALIANKFNSSTIYFVGGAVLSPLLQKILSDALILYGIKAEFDKEPEYATVKGAIYNYLSSR